MTLLRRRKNTIITPGIPQRKLLLPISHGYAPGFNPVGRPNERSRTIGFILLGSCKKGNLTGSTDLRSLLVKLSKVASDHGANAISYEKYGTEIHFEFLRVQDAILDAARRSNKTIAHGK